MNLSTSDFSTASSIDVNPFTQTGVKPCAPALIDAAHPQHERVETVICATIPRSAWRADHRFNAGDTNRSGAGLGLCIVKSIAQSHAASVDLSESKLGGLGVTLRLELG